QLLHLGANRAAEFIGTDAADHRAGVTKLVAMKREIERRTAELPAARQQVPEDFTQSDDRDGGGHDRLFSRGRVLENHINPARNRVVTTPRESSATSATRSRALSHPCRAARGSVRSADRARPHPQAPLPSAIRGRRRSRPVQPSPCFPGGWYT